MRLEAYKVDISFYEEQAIARNMPLTSGIGSPQIDRNSNEDLEATKVEILEEARSFVGTIKRVCETVDLCPRTTMSVRPGQVMSILKTSTGSPNSSWSRPSSTRSINQRQLNGPDDDPLFDDQTQLKS